MGPNTNTVEAVRIRVADTILKCCQENGITQKSLASQMGMTPSVLSRLLNDQRNMTVDDILLIAQTCKVSAVYLLTGLDIDKAKVGKLNRMLGWFSSDEQETVFNALYSVAEGMRKLKIIS